MWSARGKCSSTARSCPVAQHRPPGAGAVLNIIVVTTQYGGIERTVSRLNEECEAFKRQVAAENEADDKGEGDTCDS